jgi:3-hydroxyisobutyrate dehydrogenase-like beta-hydroxyacid dehydrogenase
MCRNLVEKGNLSKPLILYNRTPARAEALSEKLGKDKTQVATSVEEAVKDADIIFSCVGTDAAITETIDTALKVDVKGKIFVECSTIAPETTNALAKKVEAKGGSYLASPSMYLSAFNSQYRLSCYNFT